MITGMCWVAGLALMRRQTSMPSMPGIITSSSTMSGFVAVHRFERVHAVHGGHHVEIFRGELRLEQTHVGEDVVDDEDARRHADFFRYPSMVWRKLRTEMGFEI